MTSPRRPRPLRTASSRCGRPTSAPSSASAPRRSWGGKEGSWAAGGPRIPGSPPALSSEGVPGEPPAPGSEQCPCLQQDPRAAEGLVQDGCGGSGEVLPWVLGSPGGRDAIDASPVPQGQVWRSPHVHREADGAQAGCQSHQEAGRQGQGLTDGCGSGGSRGCQAGGLLVATCLVAAVPPPGAVTQPGPVPVARPGLTPAPRRGCRRRRWCCWRST